MYFEFETETGTIEELHEVTERMKLCREGTDEAGTIECLDEIRWRISCSPVTARQTQRLFVDIIMATDTRSLRLFASSLSTIADLKDACGNSPEWLILCASACYKAIADNPDSKEIAIPVLRLMGSPLAKSIDPESARFSLAALRKWPGDFEVTRFALEALSFCDSILVYPQSQEVAEFAIAAMKGPFALDASVPLVACDLLARSLQEGDRTRNAVAQEVSPLLSTRLQSSIESPRIVRGAIEALAQIATGVTSIKERLDLLTRSGVFQLACTTLRIHLKDADIPVSAAVIILRISGSQQVARGIADADWMVASQVALDALFVAQEAKAQMTLCTALYSLVSGRCPPRDFLLSASVAVRRVVSARFTELNPRTTALSLMCLCNSLASGSKFLV